MAHKILVVDDDPGIVRLLSDRLRKRGFEVATASNGEKALSQINDFCPDLMLLDIHLPFIDGFEVLRRLQNETSGPTVIVITAFGTIRLAVDAIKLGAYDFLTKPLEFDLVELTIKRALERSDLRTYVDYLREESGVGFAEKIGSSPAMHEVYDTAQRAAASNATLLLLGETGTGKEVLARAIHKWSTRADKPFVAVNCAALHEQLLESELFGHEKGAFTGAHKLRRGRFELATDGTLFLDEIAEMMPNLQAKLLRILEGHEYERLGGTELLKSDARIIAATNKDITSLVSNGRFRQDLYHRLNVVSITVPPLRERLEDMEELVAFFIGKHCAATKQSPKKLSPEVIGAFERYPWPGNVRELENIIERIVVLTPEATIRREHLPEEILEPTLSEQHRGDDDYPAYHTAVADFRRKLIEDTLRRTGGNQAKAAKQLGLQRTYLSRLIKNLDVRK